MAVSSSSIRSPIRSPIYSPTVGKWGAVTPVSTAYEGLVATRCRVPFTSVTGNKQLIAKSMHYATDDITSLKVVLGNFRAGGQAATPTGDEGYGSTATVECWIEYPAATFTRVQFSGVDSGTIPNLDYLVSDACAVTIPNGAQFWTRHYWANAGGVYYLNGVRDATASTGDLLRVAASGLSPSDAITTFTHNGGTGCAPPLAIIGTTNTVSSLIIGDSITAGYLDTANDIDGRRGSIASSLGTTMAFLNLGQSGEKANNFLTNAPVRKKLVAAGYFSHLLCGYGFNDVFVSLDSKATLIASLQAIWATAPAGRKVFQTTVTPKTSSTDSWATTTNQTPAAGDAVRIAFNADVRSAAFTGMDGYWDVTAGIESAFESGKFIVTPTPPYTTDGVHPNVAGYDLIASSGEVDPTDLVWP